MSVDPPRLAESEDGGPLARLVRESRQDLPSERDIDALKGALIPLIWPVGAPVGGGAGAGASGGSGAGLKLVAAAVISAAVGGGALWVLRSSSAPPDAPRNVPETSAPKASAPGGPQGPSHDSRPLEAPPSAGAGEALAPSAVAPEPQKPAAGPPSEPKRVAPRPSEASLLQAAQRALRTNPERALSLTRQHRQLYPSGTLAQEREVIAIQALKRLGMESESTKRADDFSRKYPGSAHQRKVDQATKQR